MIDDDAVALSESTATGTGLDDVPARFVPGDNALIAFGTFAEVLVIDAPDVGAANR
ncbi:MAG TPA: hypothetical protein VIT91_00505 [Chthoniobacterales bacterium]